MTQINEYHYDDVDVNRKKLTQLTLYPDNHLLSGFASFSILAIRPLSSQTISRHFDICDITNDMPELKISGISDGSGIYTILSKIMFIHIQKHFRAQRVQFV